MNKTEKRALQNYKKNAERVAEDVVTTLELYQDAMELIMEKGLYAELMEKQVKKAEAAMAT